MIYREDIHCTVHCTVQQFCLFPFCLKNVQIPNANPMTNLLCDFAEGRACAVVFDCKFIETSAAVQHNVKELFEGIVRQVRLRRDSKEKNERRLAYQKRRESIPKKARRFWGKIVAKNNKNMAFKLKSKSCHDLSVL